MLRRRTVVQLIVFVVIAVLGVGYTWWRYAGGSDALGRTTYPVQLRLSDGGGIFPNAEVAYRGVQVGRVGAMRLTDHGLAADLNIENSAPKIPVDTEAVVADLSAVGEQYVDLRPRSSGGPTLDSLPADKRVIPEQHTRIPTPVQNLVNNLDSLSRSVPTGSLRTVVDELDRGFSNTADDLQQLLDTAGSFTKAASANLPQTEQLLSAGRTVLDTQNDESGAVKSFSGDLQQLAAQLKNSDADIRQLITATPQAAQQVNTVLQESGPNLSVVLANLLTTSRLLEPRTSGLEMALVIYPMLTPAVQTLIPADGTAHLGLALNLFNPPPCVRGYQGTTRRPGDVTTPQRPNYNAYCAEPPGSPIDVRGSQNAPFAGVPNTLSVSRGSTSNVRTVPEQTGVFNMPALGPHTLADLLGVPR